jgi:outer membrane protein
MVRFLTGLVICIISSVSLAPAPRASTTESYTLVQAIDISMTGSDKAYDLKDSLVRSQMEVAAARHRFETKIVPLTSIGIAQGTGTQKLGMEFRRETSYGSSVSYGAVANRIDEYSGYAVENSHNASAYVRVSQGLFRRWGQRYNLTDLSRAELRAKEAEISVERERQGLVLSTVRHYYALVLASQLLTQAEKSMERSRKHLESAVSRQIIGLVSKVDVYRAELALLDTESTVEVQRRAKRRAEDSYRELLRIAVDAFVVVSGQIFKMSPVIPEGWEETVWQTRLDWQAYRVKKKVNGIELYQAERDLVPDVGLSGTVEQKGQGNSIEEALELDETNWSLQLELSSTLDTFNEENILLRKKMDTAKLRRDEQALKRKVARESRDAFLDLLFTEKSHFISLKRLQQADMALDLAKTRYEKGLSNNLDVLDAETAYSDAEVDIAKALTAYNLAAVTFAHNLGVLDREWVQLSLAPVKTINRATGSIR